MLSWLQLIAERERQRRLEEEESERLVRELQEEEDRRAELVRLEREQLALNDEAVAKELEEALNKVIMVIMSWGTVK